MLDGNCNVWGLPVADVVGVFHVSLGVLSALIIALALITYQLMRAVKARLYPWETQA